MAGVLDWPGALSSDMEEDSCDGEEGTCFTLTKQSSQEFASPQSRDEELELSSGEGWVVPCSYDSGGRETTVQTTRPIHPSCHESEGNGQLLLGAAVAMQEGRCRNTRPDDGGDKNRVLTYVDPAPCAGKGLDTSRGARDGYAERGDDDGEGGGDEGMFECGESSSESGEEEVQLRTHKRRRMVSRRINPVSRLVGELLSQEGERPPSPILLRSDEEEDASKHGKGKQSERDHTRRTVLTVHPENEWVCHVCTLINPDRYLMCDECGATRKEGSDKRNGSCISLVVPASMEHERVDPYSTDQTEQAKVNHMSCSQMILALESVEERNEPGGSAEEEERERLTRSLHTHAFVKGVDVRGFSIESCSLGEESDEEVELLAGRSYPLRQARSGYWPQHRDKGKSPMHQRRDSGNSNRPEWPMCISCGDGPCTCDGYGLREECTTREVGDLKESQHNAGGMAPRENGTVAILSTQATRKSQEGKGSVSGVLRTEREPSPVSPRRFARLRKFTYPTSAYSANGGGRGSGVWERSPGKGKTRWNDGDSRARPSEQDGPEGISLFQFQVYSKKDGRFV